MQEIEFDAQGVRLAALQFAGSRDDVVLALHGWLDNAASFQPLAEVLAGLPLIALDLPGHGRSGHRPGAGGYPILDYVSDVQAVIDQLPQSRVHLLGHSMGAGVASLLAGTLPDRLASLVLVEAVGPLTTAPAEAPEQLAQALRWQREGARTPLAYKARSRMVRARMQGRFPLSEAAAALLVARGSRACNGGWCWRHDPRLLAPSLLRLSEDQVSAFLRRIDLPAQLYLADGGIATARTHARAALIRGLEVIPVAGGHHPHLELESLMAVAEPLRRFYTELGVLPTGEDRECG